MKTPEPSPRSPEDTDEHKALVADIAMEFHRAVEAKPMMFIADPMIATVLAEMAVRATEHSLNERCRAAVAKADGEANG